jgi:exosortase/archaeosortase family protein
VSRNDDSDGHKRPVIIGPRPAAGVLPRPNSPGRAGKGFRPVSWNEPQVQNISARLNGSAARGWLLRMASDLRRGEYFAGLYIIGCANGFASRIVQAVRHTGWTDALFTTFGISAIVWGSCIAGIYLVFRDRTRGVSSREIALGALFTLLVVLPTGPLSWVAVAGLSLYIIFFTGLAVTRRGAIILLAITVPMLWSRMLFKFFAASILAVDASFVSWLLGTQRTGNLVEFVDGSGRLEIYQSCSSLANVSLAILCWVAFSQLTSHKRSNYDVLWCIAACASVVAVNVSRIAILGLSEGSYQAFHNQWGDAVGNVAILALIIGISALGVRRELFQRT